MNRQIIIIDHDVWFVEAQGRLIKAEFLTITDLIESETDYIDLDKTQIGA